MRMTATSKHAGQVSDILRTAACSSNIFLNLDNTMSFGFICAPFTGSDPKAEDRLRNSLNANWPKNTIIQFTLLGLGDVMAQLKNRMLLRDMYMAKKRGNTTTQDDVLKAISEETDKFLKSGIDNPLVRDTKIHTKDYKLIVSVSFPCKVDQLDAEMIDARRLMRQAHSGLAAAGLGPVSMDEDAYLRIMSLIFNHSKSASWRQNLPVENDPQKEVREQIPDFNTDIRVDRNGFYLGDTRVNVFSPKRYPNVVRFGSASQYIGDFMTGQRGIHSPFMLTMNIHFGDPATERQKLEMQGQFAQNQRSSQFARYVPQIMKRAADFDRINESIERGNSVCRISTTLVLFGKDEETLQADSASATSYWSELGFNLLPDKFISIPLFANALPMGASCDLKVIKDLKRFKTMTTEHVTCLLPIFADWKGTGTPMFSFLSRNGQLMNMSLYDSATNYNCVIAAESGAGKSFLTNEIIQSTLSTGGRAWVIDVGRSYEKLADVLDGKFICFEEGSDICLNPFPLIDNYNEEEDLLMALVAAMASRDSNLSDIQAANLKKHMSECFAEHGKDMTFDHLAARLLANTDGMEGTTDGRLHDIGKQLYPFTTEGTHGKFFNGPNNLDLNNNFIVLELEELKGRAQLQQVVLLQLIYQIQNEMYRGEKGQKKLVLIDEAWDLLNSGDVSKFIESGYRRFRKYGGSCTIITQSMMDLFDSPVGNAIRSNSANTYLLSQKNDQIDLMRDSKALAIGDAGYELLKTVRSDKGKFSEIMFHTSDYGAGIGRLIVDPFRALLYTTNAEDVAALDFYRKQGMSVTDAIYAVLNDRQIYRAAE